MLAGEMLAEVALHVPGFWSAVLQLFFWLNFPARVVVAHCNLHFSRSAATHDEKAWKVCGGGGGRAACENLEKTLYIFP